MASRAAAKSCSAAKNSVSIALASCSRRVPVSCRVRHSEVRDSRSTMRPCSQKPTALPDSLSPPSKFPDSSLESLGFQIRSRRWVVGGTRPPSPLHDSSSSSPEVAAGPGALQARVHACLHACRHACRRRWQRFRSDSGEPSTAFQGTCPASPELRHARFPASPRSANRVSVAAPARVNRARERSGLA